MNIVERLLWKVSKRYRSHKWANLSRAYNELITDLEKIVNNCEARSDMAVYLYNSAKELADQERITDGYRKDYDDYIKKQEA